MTSAQVRVLTDETNFNEGLVRELEKNMSFVQELNLKHKSSMKDAHIKSKLIEEIKNEIELTRMKIDLLSQKIFGIRGINR